MFGENNRMLDGKRFRSSTYPESLHDCAGKSARQDSHPLVAIVPWTNDVLCEVL